MLRDGVGYCTGCQQRKPGSSFVVDGRLLAACAECRAAALKSAPVSPTPPLVPARPKTMPAVSSDRAGIYRRLDAPNVALTPSDRDRYTLEWTFANNPTLGVPHAARR